VSWTCASLAGLALAGWGMALALVVVLRRRRALIADAEHELRGAAAAIGLAAERTERSGSSAAFASLVRLQLDRIAAGLADLAAARGAGRAPPAAPELEAGRLAQVLGNLIANAAEHGAGPVDVSTTREAGVARLEIRNRDRPRALDDLAAARAAGRGRGLAIAERAARDLGGRLSVESTNGETRVTLELPVGRGRVAAPPGGQVAAETGDQAGAPPGGRAGAATDGPGEAADGSADLSSAA
jgi:signal transduction histidine kinase